ELAFYGAMGAMLDRKTTLRNLLQAAGMCLVYRMTLGAVFSFTIAVMYSMSISISLALGMFGYVPVILVQVVAAPFVLRPILKQLLSRQMDTQIQRQPFAVEEQVSEGVISVDSTQTRTSRVPRKRESQEQDTRKELENRMETLPEMPLSGGNGFERATRYIGEDASVQLAAVVDDEGLLLGQFHRGDVKPDDWAPFPLLFRDANKSVLARAGNGNPEKIRIDLADKRMIVAFGKSFSLFVVSERQAEEFINIRINQGLEIIKKYITERYNKNMFEKPEKTHVRSAQ
ncbi:MAG: hypothetical protein U9R56_08040, partial [candidate division Zixibacteria bacterium]|nr:hypothetical protein [candidate division Zixibacteria bacterium]